MPLALGLFMWRRWYDLGEAPRWSPAFSPPMAVGMFVSMLLLGMGGAGIVGVLVDGSGGGEMTVPALSDKALMLAGHVAAQAIVVAVYVWRSRTSPVQPSRPGMGRAALAGAGAYLLVLPLVATAAFASGLVVQRVTGEPPEPIAHDAVEVASNASYAVSRLFSTDQLPSSFCSESRVWAHRSVLAPFALLRTRASSLTA